MHNYIFFCHIEDFCKASKHLLLVANRYNIPKDIRLYLCRHLGYLYDILPHPSHNSQDYIKTVIFSNIDRGISYYKFFALFLKRFFPNMIRLSLRQKYSNSTMEELIFFIKELHLETLLLYDTCGEYYSDIDWNEILKIMPNDSQYQIWLEFENQEDNEKKTKLKEESKSIIIYKYGDPSDVLSNRYENIIYKLHKHIMKGTKGSGPNRNYYIF
jgi:hypothetical protein